jgi:hypothetical protein
MKDIARMIEQRKEQQQMRQHPPPALDSNGDDGVVPDLPAMTADAAHIMATTSSLNDRADDDDITRDDPTDGRFVFQLTSDGRLIPLGQHAVSLDSETMAQLLHYAQSQLIPQVPDLVMTLSSARQNHQFMHNEPTD